MVHGMVAGVEAQHALQPVEACPGTGEETDDEHRVAGLRQRVLQHVAIAVRGTGSDGAGEAPFIELDQGLVHRPATAVGRHGQQGRVLQAAHAQGEHLLGALPGRAGGAARGALHQQHVLALGEAHGLAVAGAQGGDARGVGQQRAVHGQGEDGARVGAVAVGAMAQAMVQMASRDGSFDEGQSRVHARADVHRRQLVHSGL